MIMTGLRFERPQEGFRARTLFLVLAVLFIVMTVVAWGSLLSVRKSAGLDGASLGEFSASHDKSEKLRLEYLGEKVKSLKSGLPLKMATEEEMRAAELKHENGKAEYEQLLKRRTTARNEAARQQRWWIPLFGISLVLSVVMLWIWVRGGRNPLSAEIPEASQSP